MRRKRLLLLLGALALVAAACGGATEEAGDTAPTTTAMEGMSDDSMADMDDMEGMEDGHDHEHEHGEGTEWTGSEVPSVEVSVEGDAETGWTVTALIGDTFRFGSPENVVHEDGVGHAHLIIDGVVAQMIYEPTVRIESLDPGMHMIEVRLSSSDHTDYVYEGSPVGGMAMIEVAGEVTPADVMVMATYSAGAIETAAERVEVSVGDVVEIMVSSDVAEEIHVHGYDVFMPIEAGGSAVLRFTAEVPGIFEVELEESGALIVELEIS